MFSNMYSLISKEKMMKIVWSIICLQYFGSINKMNLNRILVVGVPSRHWPSAGETAPGCLHITEIQVVGVPSRHRAFRRRDSPRMPSHNRDTSSRGTKQAPALPPARQTQDACTYQRY